MRTGTIGEPALAVATRPWTLAFGLVGLAVLLLVVGLVALVTSRRRR